MLPLKFKFTPSLKSIPIPLVISEEWITKKHKELNDCFRLLNLKIREIDSCTVNGKGELQTAAYLSEFYINYRIEINIAARGFYGTERESDINPDTVYTKPLRQG